MRLLAIHINARDIFVVNVEVYRALDQQPKPVGIYKDLTGWRGLTI